MKKIVSGVMGMALAALTLVSCSKDENSSSSDLISQIPADAEMVFVGDFATVAQSAEVEITTDGISSLPSYLTDLIPVSTDDLLKQANEEIKNWGVDVTAVAVFYQESLSEPVVVARVTDSSALASFLKGEDFEESTSDGFKVYTKTYDWDWASDVSCVVVNGNYAYSYVDEVYVSGDDDPKRDLVKAVKSVASGNFASTPAGEYIAKGNAGGMALVCSEKNAKRLRRQGLPADMARDAEGAFIGMRFDLNGSELKLTTQVLDKNGSNFDFSKYAGVATPATPATISQKAVEYLAPETCALAALTFGDVDWNAVIDQVVNMGGVSNEEETVMRMAVTYLKSLEGTVTIGVGVKDGLYSIARLANDRNRRPFDDLVLSAAVQTKPGKAQGMFRDMASMLAASGLPYGVTDNGVSISIDEIGATFYISAFDDMITLSTVPISGRSNNAVTKAVSFGGNNGALAIVLNKNSSIMEQLGANIGLQLLAATDPSNVEFTVSLKALGTSDPLLKALIKLGFDVYGNMYRLLPVFNGVSSSVDYFNDYDYEEAAADSMFYAAEDWDMDWED